MYKYSTDTLFTAKKVIHLPSCQSTNDKAAELLLSESDCPEGTVVITDCQTAGRGQRGNVWQSRPGSDLTFSVIYRPHFLTPDQNFRLNATLSLAVCRALSGLRLPDLRLKWPNDLYVGDRKVGGMLIELTLRAGRIESAVIGIGLNIGPAGMSVPGAAALADFCSPAPEIGAVFGTICSSLEAHYLQLRAGNYDKIKAEYLSVLYRYQERSEFVTAENERFFGEILGVDAQGRLGVSDGKKIRYFNMKEIAFADRADKI